MTNPIDIETIDHVVIRVSDLDRMLAFYRDVLGCRLERRKDDIGLVQLRAGDSLIDLVPVEGRLGRAGGAAPGREGRNMDHLCLRIAAVRWQAVDAWLASHGVETRPPATRYGADGYGPSIYLEDPEGNVVELKQAG